MPITLIEQFPKVSRSKPDHEDFLEISEMFFDTIQGEGVSAGISSTFMRLQGCTLKCVWCDTLKVWEEGNPYTFDELFLMMNNSGIVDRLRFGQHLILTGGSPLKQQDRLIKFILKFKNKFGFKPYIEVENEAVLQPKVDLVNLVDQWNNSPKLSNSGMKVRVRCKQEIVSLMSRMNNSWFKFVVATEADWDEIEKDYLPFIRRNQIIIMPKGETREELNETRDMAADMAVKHGVRFSDRLHITIWNKQTGV